MDSLFLDDVAAGMEFVSPLSDPISDEMVRRYCDLSGDAFAIHTDDDFARRCGLEGAIVPGNLIIAIATGLIYRTGYLSESLFVQGSKSVTFLRPLYIGERVFVRDRIISVASKPLKAHGRVVIDRVVFNEPRVPVMRIDQDYRVFKRNELSPMQRHPAVDEAKP